MSDFFQLRCPDCSSATTVTKADLVTRLQDAGMLRRAENTDAEFVLALFTDVAKTMCCEQCGRAGLVVEFATSDDDDWDEAENCSACGQPIPPERLELFPDATHCAACQSQGRDVEEDEPEFCPKCGALMVMRQSSSGGITRYVMACSECRR